MPGVVIASTQALATHQVGHFCSVGAQPEQAGLPNDVPQDDVSVLGPGCQLGAAAAVAQRSHCPPVPGQGHLGTSHAMRAKGI